MKDISGVDEKGNLRVAERAPLFMHMERLMKKVALGTVLIATACISVNKTVLMDRSMSPVAEADVHVFLPRDEIPETCQRVAILNASGDEDLTDESQMINKLREEAGKLGANAIVMGEIEDPGGGERIASALFGTSSDRDSQAEALWCPTGFGARENSVEPVSDCYRHGLPPYGSHRRSSVV